MKKKRWWKTTLYWLVIILGLALSLVLIFNQQVKDYLVNTYQPQVTKSLVAKKREEKGQLRFQQRQGLESTDGGRGPGQEGIN